MPPAMNGWTPERRARQALLIRQGQPWKRSTGPRTPEGKAVSSRNAFKPYSIRKELLALAAQLRDVQRQITRIAAARCRFQRKNR